MAVLLSELYALQAGSRASSAVGPCDVLLEVQSCGTARRFPGGKALSSVSPQQA